MNPTEELSLIKQAQGGNREAVGLLWDDLTPRLFGYLINTLKDKALAEDVLQNTWIKAIEALPKFQPRGYGLSAWLFAIARNECRQHWRKGDKETLMDENQDFQAPDNYQTFDNIFAIDKILNKLSADDQEILRLRYISDLPISQVAKVLNISGINARVKLHRAIKRAKEMTKLTIIDQK